MEDLYLQSVQTLKLEKVSELLGEISPQEVYFLFKEGDIFNLKGTLLKVVKKNPKELICRLIN